MRASWPAEGEGGRMQVEGAEVWQLGRPRNQPGEVVEEEAVRVAARGGPGRPCGPFWGAVQARRGGMPVASGPCHVPVVRRRRAEGLSGGGQQLGTPEGWRWKAERA